MTLPVCPVCHEQHANPAEPHEWCPSPDFVAEGYAHGSAPLDADASLIDRGIAEARRAFERIRADERRRVLSTIAQEFSDVYGYVPDGWSSMRRRVLEGSTPDV